MACSASFDEIEFLNYSINNFSSEDMSIFYRKKNLRIPQSENDVFQVIYFPQ